MTFSAKSPISTLMSTPPTVCFSSLSFQRLQTGLTIFVQTLENPILPKFELPYDSITNQLLRTTKWNCRQQQYHTRHTPYPSFSDFNLSNSTHCSKSSILKGLSITVLSRILLAISWPYHWPATSQSFQNSSVFWPIFCVNQKIL